MKQPNEKGTQKDLVLYRIETAQSDIKAAEILLGAKEFRGANNRDITESIMLCLQFIIEGLRPLFFLSSKM